MDMASWRIVHQAVGVAYQLWSLMWSPNSCDGSSIWGIRLQEELVLCTAFQACPLLPSSPHSSSSNTDVDVGGGLQPTADCVLGTMEVVDVDQLIGLDLFLKNAQQVLLHFSGGCFPYRVIL